MLRGVQAPEPTVEIVRASAEDAPAVGELVTRFFLEEGFELPEERLEARVRTYIDQPGHAIFAARRGSEAVGVATVMTSYGLEYGWSAELEDLYVLPEERGHGLARRLVDAVAEWAASRGCSAVLVTVTPEGEHEHSLTAFYARLDFRDDGRKILERRLPGD